MRTVFRCLSLLWMGTIFYLSSLTGRELSDLPAVNEIIGHGFLYFVLGLLLYFSFRKRQGPLTVLTAFLYGLSDEFHQSFVPGRTPEISDLLVDTLAALLAVCLLAGVRKFRR